MAAEMSKMKSNNLFRSNNLKSYKCQLYGINSKGNGLFKTFKASYDIT